MSEESEVTTIIKPKKLIGCRHVQMLMLFIGVALAYGCRVVMSIAIVVMTDDGQDNLEHTTLNWNTFEQTLVLSAFMVGHIVSQVPGRRLSARFGGKAFMAVGVAGSAVVAVFIPIGAYGGGWGLVMICRVLQGLAQGTMLPALGNLIDKWIPLQERRNTETLALCAMLTGVILQLLISGFVIEAWGWQAVFYLNTITGAIWTICYIAIGSNSAESFKFISDDEREYIKNSLKQVDESKDEKTPWQSLWTSLPFLSLLIANCAHNWGTWTLVTLLPLYWHQTQGVSVVQNGVLTAVIYTAMLVMILPFRYISNLVIKKNCISVTATRKICSGIGFFGPSACLLSLPLFASGAKIATVIITAAMVLNAAQFSGFMLTYDEMAPKFSRRMRRITNGFANLVSAFAPVTAGVMLGNNNNVDNWRYVFNLTAYLYIGSGIFYIVFGTSIRQQWDNPYNEYGGDTRQQRQKP